MANITKEENKPHKLIISKRDFYLFNCYYCNSVIKNGQKAYFCRKNRRIFCCQECDMSYHCIKNNSLPYFNKENDYTDGGADKPHEHVLVEVEVVE